VYIGETTAEARRQALAGPLARDWNGYFLPLLRKTKRMGLPKVDPNMPDADVTVEYLLDNIWIVGDVDTVTGKLAKLRDEAGGFGSLLVIGHEWEPRESWVRSMTLLREQVLPRL
jgi:alkanesulfonate monooxygenase SsuD/methylene tetrahydromethanopterin reductase-like flavin-dependent oxidoreductase (luciferase family)